ncbi:MAG: N-acetylmuramoyl-L-alanine amidase [bacterium]
MKKLTSTLAASLAQFFLHSKILQPVHLSIWLLLSVTLPSPALTTIGTACPVNHTRPVRARTDYIVLHTTEGTAVGALRKLSQNGEAHYMVATDGRVYRIVDRARVATHAGRSMWNGRVTLDNTSIGIEVVGSYNRPPMRAQAAALRELLRQLQTAYHVPDENVLTHSMVAYGEPNQWFRRDHRGRKRCGMLMGTDSVRRELGLASKPAYDPDVRASRLTVGDPYLARVLYGAKADAESYSAGQRTTAAQAMPARQDSAAAQSFYFFSDGRVSRGDLLSDAARRSLPPQTFVLSGYQFAGEVNTNRSVLTIAGRRWQEASTIYRLPDGHFTHGARLGGSALPIGTLVFFRK